MHRGKAIIITKDQRNNEFVIYESTEFNGAMGMENNGGKFFKMLSQINDIVTFDTLIRRFDENYYHYYDTAMTYIMHPEDNAYTDQYNRKCYEYYKINNQFNFFKDSNNKYIYTSDSNYIKNLTNEDVIIICENGKFILKPNQIMVTDFAKCINNTEKNYDEIFEEDAYANVDTLTEIE
ncbi:MAG: hypothetical protein LUG46_05895 [Erysipelotrichaceae bacterium]|nr:hypothetical protein [Erysipelotrichaceae bacterium]